jgi:hypothetical protein
MQKKYLYLTYSYKQSYIILVQYLGIDKPTHECLPVSNAILKKGL